ncbi:hypothetical protein [uncultured Methanobrevibacter sp.]|jgi:hypothetical protein|uniref:hypothetical protein n=1 Tax=uncultured Methanobrevibacter sp. TaxID=253161 RepID=UPI0025F2A360|nr:hypothetical protein [uncultured Methanobrevibacter sp.]MBR4591131.1 hypothetical protein [Bacteroidaceae bacterium]
MKPITAEQFVALTTNAKYSEVELTKGFVNKIQRRLKQEYNIPARISIDDFDELHRKYPMFVYSGNIIKIKVDGVFIKEIQSSTKELSLEIKNQIRKVYMECQ